MQRAGSDGLLGTVDDPLTTISSAAPAGNTTTLTFAALPEDVYRLTVHDTVTDASGNALDGDGNGTAGGDWRKDFVVGALSTSLMSPNGFVFDPEYGGFGAGQLVQGTGNAFDGLGRRTIDTSSFQDPSRFRSVEQQRLSAHHQHQRAVRQIFLRSQMSLRQRQAHHL